MKKLLSFILVILVTTSVFSLSMSDFKLSNQTGSRKDPLTQRNGYVVIRTLFSEIQMGFSGCLRGDLVDKIVTQANFLNENPKPGYEYAMVYFYVQNNKDLTGNDYAYPLSSVSFSVANLSYKKTDNFCLIASVPDMLDVELYEGMTDEGFVICQVPKGEPFYLVFNEIWFYVPAESSKFEDL